MTAVLKPEIQDAEKPATGLALAQHNGLKDLVPANSVTGLLQSAIEKGASVEQLEKLVGLYERMEERSARADFAAAMKAFQEECPSIKKASTAKIVTSGGGNYTYTYAELDDIARTVNPILAKHGLSYSWDSSADEKAMLTCTCTLRHVAGHSVSSSFTLPTASKSAMSEQQKYASALTFAKRQSLSSVLGLTTTDDDTDAAEIDPTQINEEQVLLLDELITEVNANKEKFFAFMGVDSLSQMRVSDYDRAIANLERKREKKAS